MEDNQRYSVPAEASAFLWFVGVCMVFLVVFYLYLTKKFCFVTIGNFPCCDEPLKIDKKKINQDLKSSFAYEDEGDTSTDSEEEVLQRLYRSSSSYNNLKRQSSAQHKHHPDEKRRESYTSDLSIKQSRSSDRLLPRSPSGGCSVSHLHKLTDGSPMGFKTGSPSIGSNSTISTIGTARTTEYETQSRNSTRENHSKVPNGRAASAQDTSNDLISLAEKGKLGKEGSSGGSCSSESGSAADTEEEALVPFLHEKAKQKASEVKTGKEQSEQKSEKSEGDDKSGIRRRESGSSGKSRSARGAEYSNDGFEKTESPTPLGQETRSTKGEQEEEATSSSQPDSSGMIKCGSLEISHAYDAPTRKLTISVIQARDLPSKDRGGANQVHVRLVLLPHKRQKCKTKGRLCGTGSPQFNETFTFSRINPEDILNLGIRFRLYSCERIRREHLIGECCLAFSCSKPLQHETRLWLTLEPRSNLIRSDSRSDVSSLARSDSTGSTQSMQNASLPELLLGLAYNGTTGRLQVSVIKGSQFKNPTMSRAPDTLVKLSLVSSSGQEIARSKSSIRRGQPNPLFKETFVFQVALFQLPDVTLMVSVYNRRSMKRKEMIGWFSLGLNSSGEEESSHWNEMREQKGEQVCRWHVLLDS